MLSSGTAGNTKTPLASPKLTPTKETIVEKPAVENMDVDPTQAVEKQKQVRESREPKKFKNTHMEGTLTTTTQGTFQTVKGHI
jgi:hypothetical protein